MKKILFILSLAFFGLGLNAQNHYYEVFDSIHLSDTGDDTLTVSKTINDAGYYIFGADVESWNGTSAGAISYQTAARGSTYWVTVATDTIATGDGYLYKTDILKGDKFRVIFDGSGTQETGIYGWFIFKKGL